MTPTTVITIFCGVLLVLCLLWFLEMRSKVNKMYELGERLRDKWASTQSLCQKLEAGIVYLLAEKGMHIESTGSWTTPWVVGSMGTARQRQEMEDAWKGMCQHREDLVKAIYEANMQTLIDWDKTKKKGGKKK